MGSKLQNLSLSEGSLIFRNARWPYVLSLAGSLAVFGIGVYAMMDRGPSWILWTLIVLFGGSSAVCISVLMNPKPILIVSETGICVGHWSIGTISWDEFSGAFIKTDSGVDYICFTLRQPEEHRLQMGKIGRVFNNATKATGFGDLTVRPADMGLDAYEVLKLVREQIDQAKAKPKPTVSSYKYNGRSSDG